MDRKNLRKGIYLQRKSLGKKDGKFQYEDIEEPVYFHGFSISYEELNQGVGSFPVVIFETEDGKVDWCVLSNFKFTS